MSYTKNKVRKYCECHCHNNLSMIEFWVFVIIAYLFGVLIGTTK